MFGTYFNFLYLLLKKQSLLTNTVYFKFLTCTILFQNQLFNPKIWSSSDNKMLVKDEIGDFGYSSEWIKEIEPSYQNQEYAFKKYVCFDCIH